MLSFRREPLANLGFFSSLRPGICASMKVLQTDSGVQNTTNLTNSTFLLMRPLLRLFAPT